MFRRLEKINQEKEELDKIARLPANRKLKYWALFFASVGIALFIIMIIFFESLSREAIFLMRGFAGLFAIFFVVIDAIYLYRINSAYQKQRFEYTKENGKYGKD